MRYYKASILLVSLAAAFLSGCTTVGPDYEAPVSTVPDVWFETAVAGVAEGDASLQTWWTQLDDPMLSSLIERAGASNLDLREALARINVARANLGIVSGERLPRVDAVGDASRSQLSDNGALDQVAPADGFQAQNLFNLGIDASWEIDVFGRIRRSTESAQASYEESLEDYRDVLVTLFAEVARNYIGVRETQKRIQFAETNAAAQRATLRLTRDRHDAGATSGLDVVQAESNLRNTEAQIPSLKIQLNIYLNSLAVLLGEYPGALDEELEPEAPMPLPPGELTVSIPADLLRQRPDIRSRERALAAQTARIGVATADLYPRFSLSGFFAVSARDVGDLFDGDSVTWGISLPIRWQTLRPRPHPQRHRSRAGAHRPGAGGLRAHRAAGLRRGRELARRLLARAHPQGLARRRHRRHPARGRTGLDPVPGGPRRFPERPRHGTLAVDRSRTSSLSARAGSCRT